MKIEIFNEKEIKKLKEKIEEKNKIIEKQNKKIEKLKDHIRYYDPFVNFSKDYFEEN